MSILIETDPSTWGHRFNPHCGKLCALHWEGGITVQGADGESQIKLLGGRSFEKVDISNDGTKVAAGGDQEGTVLVDLESGEVISEWEHPKGPGPGRVVPSPNFSPDSRRLAIGLKSKTWIHEIGKSGHREVGRSKAISQHHPYWLDDSFFALATVHKRLQIFSHHGELVTTLENDDDVRFATSSPEWLLVNGAQLWNRKDWSRVGVIDTPALYLAIHKDRCYGVTHGMMWTYDFVSGRDQSLRTGFGPGVNDLLVWNGELYLAVTKPGVFRLIPLIDLTEV